MKKSRTKEELFAQLEKDLKAGRPILAKSGQTFHHPPMDKKEFLALKKEFSWSYSKIAATLNTPVRTVEGYSQGARIPGFVAKALRIFKKAPFVKGVFEHDHRGKNYDFYPTPQAVFF